MRDIQWAYRLRWKRRQLLWRAFRARRSLRSSKPAARLHADNEILAFVTVRNERLRLPYFLTHHRALGVDRFFIVDNNSEDGSAKYLLAQGDVELWSTPASYRDARFGMDWLTWLMTLHGHNHWCLTLDCDELLIYPHHKSRDLRELTQELDARGQRAMAAPMIELYPKGPINLHTYEAGRDPLDVLSHLDPDPYSVTYQSKLWTRRLQGGVRRRHFFADAPNLAPTLNKTPLVRWHRRFAYNNSTHTLLPRALNRDADAEGTIKGALLHTKFLPDAASRAKSEHKRKEHFRHPEDYEDYYRRLTMGPDLWTEKSVRFQGWEQLCSLGFMSVGGWT